MGHAATQFGDHARQNRQEPIDFRLRIKPSQADPKQTSRLFRIVSHGKQHAGRLSRMMRTACAARRHGDAGGIEREEQLAHFPFLAAKSETQMPRQPFRRMTK